MTLAERFISWFRLPYLLGAVLIGGVWFGFLPPFLVGYAATRDPLAAVLEALAPVPFLIDVLVVWALYATRFMRLQVEQTGATLARLHPEGEAGYRSSFEGMGAPAPQLVTWVLFLEFLLLALSVPALMGTGPPPIQFEVSDDPTGLSDLAAIFTLGSFAVVTLALSSVVWSYGSISMGIRRFSNSALRLRPYYEDEFLGLRPVGTLSLALATAYFAFIGLFLATLLASPEAPRVAELLGMGSLLIGLVLLGVSLFFVPMRTLHERMAKEKRRARERLAEELAPWFRESTDSDPPGDVRDVLRLELMERKVSAMATWPFDTGILGRLTVIAVSVTAILISRLLALFLGI